MTDIESEFVDHPRFERADGGFAPTTNDWTATARVEDGAVTIAVTVPTIQAATTEHVAEVVADGWFDTLERRIQDAESVTLADDVTVAAVASEDGEVAVELELDPRDGKAADDALALVNYVEGTWFEGLIPGYDYRSDVRELRERATQQGEGTPL